MEALIGFLVQILIVSIPLLISWLGGRAIERRLRDSVVRREQENAGVLATDLRTFPGDADPAAGGALVEAGVVLGVNYLRTFIGGFRKIFGGELGVYTRVVEMARREATQRLLEEAKARGFDAVCGIRFDSSDIGGGSGTKGVPMVVLFASGTAYRRRRCG